MQILSENIIEQKLSSYGDSFRTIPTKILVVISCYYPHIAGGLLAGIETALTMVGSDIEIIEVPGTLEIASAIRIAQNAKQSRPDLFQYDGYIAAGCVIRGQTSHDNYINMSTIDAITRLGSEHGIAIGNAILTVNNEEQAIVRSDPSRGNKGGWAALATLSLINLQRHFLERSKRFI